MRTLVLVAALVVLSVACTAPSSPAPSAPPAPPATAPPAPGPPAAGRGAPPAEVIVTGSCPFEGCQLGNWTARDAVPLYDAPAGTALPSSIRKGEVVTAVTSQVRATPRRGVITKTHATDAERGLTVGAIAYALHPTSEGAIAVWHDGDVKPGSIDLTLRYDEPLESRPLEWAWWVQVRRADGSTAWIRSPFGQFDGMDSLA